MGNTSSSSPSCPSDARGRQPLHAGTEGRHHPYRSTFYAPAIMAFAMGPHPPTAFAMEGSTTEAMCHFPHSHYFPLPVVRSLSFTVHRLLRIPSAVLLRMGRRSKFTQEQLDFLESYVSDLDRAKETSTLTSLYQTVYDKYILRWPFGDLPPGPGKSAEKVLAEAKEGLQRVCIPPHLLCSRAHGLPANCVLVWASAKEGKAPNPIRPTSTSRPRLIRQVEP